MAGSLRFNGNGVSFREQSLAFACTLIWSDSGSFQRDGRWKFSQVSVVKNLLAMHETWAGDMVYPSWVDP